MMVTEDTLSPPPLILASTSPRRFELLSRLNVSFEVKSADINEEEVIAAIRKERTGRPIYSDARKTALMLAAKKAQVVSQDFPRCVIIGADTVVATDTAILGKPSSNSEAIDMLRSLCGQKHRVYTAVSIRQNDHEKSFCSKTTVTFRPADPYQDQLIECYAETGSPLDKAGGYGIQDMGALLISEIKGDYYTVVGLPIARLARELVRFGYGPQSYQGGALCPD
ncbi:MAG: septum formation protein Maf [Clostridiales bacterium]|nr:septum formation protein Maf [Clostridiales bacterium]